MGQRVRLEGGEKPFRNFLLKKKKKKTPGGGVCVCVESFRNFGKQQKYSGEKHFSNVGRGGGGGSLSVTFRIVF